MNSVAPKLANENSLVDIRNWVSTILHEEGESEINWARIAKLSVGLAHAVRRIDASCLPAYVHYFADDWELRRADPIFADAQRKMLVDWLSEGR
jgi:hypothetical protein